MSYSGEGKAELLEATLGAILDSVAGLLHPRTLGQLAREIGMKLGRQANEGFRLTKGVCQPFSRRDYVRCMQSLKELWGWECAILEESANSLSIGIAVCPFGHSAVCRAHVCELASGILGSIAAEQFGYAKVCIKQGCGVPPRNCCATIYIRETDESLTAEGQAYLNNGYTGDRQPGLGAREPQMPRLSKREYEVLRLVAKGMSDKEVATALNISVRTAANHAARLRAKLGLSGRLELLRFAVRSRLVDL